MKSLPYWFVALATLFVIVGMIWGVQMSITQDHLLAPAHAHNNLIGFVVMTVYGFYYRLVPAAANTRLAVVHFWLALIGALTFGPGVALAILAKGEVLIQISTLFVLASMLIFAFTVWTNKAGLTNP
jgi:cbb3-type cytochrome oxidase subunit 1